jgi:5-methylcytosine-specific restriction endonuclease McrA
MNLEFKIGGQKLVLSLNKTKPKKEKGETTKKEKIVKKDDVKKVTAVKKDVIKKESTAVKDSVKKESTAVKDSVKKDSVKSEDVKKKDVTKKKDGTAVEGGRVRKAVPKQIRNMVWEKYNGRSMDGHCFCCRGVIKLENWHVGHYISFKNGGTDEITNLRPLCVACNLSMSDTDMDIFMILYGMYQQPTKK